MSEKDIKEAMRQVRLASVGGGRKLQGYQRNLWQRSAKSADGTAEVMKSLTPGQQVIKIVQQELTELMGGQHAKLQGGKQTTDGDCAMRPAGCR